MPKHCKIPNCKNLAKWISKEDKNTYICSFDDDTHQQIRTIYNFVKIINCPCVKCIEYGIEPPKESSYGENINGKLKRMYCLQHKPETCQKKMESKRHCEHEGCTTEPSYCNPGETKRRWCNLHKPEKFTRNNMCIHVFSNGNSCDIQASYNYNNETRALFCNTHKSENMININDKNRGCTIEHCTVKRATYGFPGDSKPTRCSAHSDIGMEDIVNKKCISCGLFIAVSSKQFLCSYCSPTNQRQRTKENTVKVILEQYFDNYHFIYNKVFQSDSLCMLSRYRPDFSLDLGTHYIIVECDEDCHRQYDKQCELKRMYEISYGLGLPCIFIRYNPDSSFVMKDILIKHCDARTRKKHLITSIKYYLSIITVENISDYFAQSNVHVHYVCYDNDKDDYEQQTYLYINNDTLEINEIRK